MTQIQLQLRRFNHPIQISHTLAMPPCCPVSKNPRDGSEVTIRYTTVGSVLDVLCLPDYLRTFINGKGEIRSAEDMIDQIADDVLVALDSEGASVTVTAVIILQPDTDGKPNSITIQATR